MAKKSWSDMTPTQKKIVVVTGIAEVALTTWCLRDLKQRPAELVRGPKVAVGAGDVGAAGRADRLPGVGPQALSAHPR